MAADPGKNGRSGKDFPPSQCEHVVQLFDCADSLADAVASFLAEGISRGDSAVMVTKPANTRAIGEALNARGCSIQCLIDEGRLVVVDAAAALQTFMRAEAPDPHRFDEHVGNLVRRLAASMPGCLRVYGEMVELLAEEGNFRAAEELEDLWNDLGREVPFTLLCGYSSAHFAAPNIGSALRDVCRRHSRVHQDEEDLLANWLLSASERAPAASSLRAG